MQYLSWTGIEALGYLQSKRPRKAGDVLEGEGLLPHVLLSSPQSPLLVYMARSWWWGRRGEAGTHALSGNAIVRERWWLPPAPHGGLSHSEALRITDLRSLINIYSYRKTRHTDTVGIDAWVLYIGNRVKWAIERFIIIWKQRVKKKKKDTTKVFLEYLVFHRR